MKWRQVIATLMGMLFIAVASPEKAIAESQLAIKMVKAGDGTSTLSSSLTVQFEISGGNSGTALSCAQYLSQNKSIKIALTADSVERTKPIDDYTVKTLTISPTSLSCELNMVPSDLFGTPWKFSTPQVSLTIKIYNENLVLDQKNLSMTDSSSIKPKLSIVSPLRASQVPGEFTVTTSIQNSSYWKVESTYVGAGIGAAFFSCNGMIDAGTKINNFNTPTRFSRANGFIVTQQSSTTFKFEFLYPGQYTLCIYQNFASIAEPNVKAVSEVIGIVNVTSAMSSISLDYDDELLEYGGYTIKFLCPETISSSKNFDCTLQAVQTGSLRFYDQGFKPSLATKIVLTGMVPVVVCEFDNNTYRGVGCGSGEKPPYFSKTETVLVGFEKPISINVNNNLTKTGFTGVEINRSSTGKETYAWKANDYDAKNKKAASAPPSKEFQSTLANAVRTSMKSKCQKLPKNFNSSTIIFSKRITSRDGIPGYLLVINKKTNIQVYDTGNAWQYGASTATADQKTWKSWGCERSIWIY
jgi:hypothetical protein